MRTNILLINDDPAETAAVRRVLIESTNGAFEVESASSSEGLERLTSQGAQATIAAVVVDPRLPDSRGIDTIDRLLRAAPQIPILVLSAPRDEDIARMAVKHGAQDYLLKTGHDGHEVPALKRMVERAVNAAAPFTAERAQVTLHSIGDAVMSTDVTGKITYLNPAAESMTGWSREAAAGHPVEEVFRIIDGTTRKAVQSPTALAIRQDRTVALTPNCVLIRRDGVEVPIEDCAAPVHDHHGCVTGAVTVFRDVSTTRALAARLAHQAQHDVLTGLPNRMLLN